MAAKFFFYPRARSDLKSISIHTVKSWGAVQKETYISALYGKIEQAAERQTYWHPLPSQIGLPGYFVKHGSHIIVFRVFKNETLGIVSILHKRMDMVSRLPHLFNQDDSAEKS